MSNIVNDSSQEITETPVPFEWKHNDFSHYNETPDWVDKFENHIKRILTPIFKKLKLDKHCWFVLDDDKKSSGK